jgi:hypothetical protein
MKQCKSHTEVRLNPVVTLVPNEQTGVEPPPFTEKFRTGLAVFDVV